MSGHTVLALPVEPLDDLVRTRTRFYDATFVAEDPDFVHAHITLLAPWVGSPRPADLDVVAEIARSTAEVAFTLEELAEFPDGTIHLLPHPDDQIRQLTERIAAAFPTHLPYEGRFEPVPHLTLDRRSETVDMESVARTVAHLLPVHMVADRIDLQWWDNNDCRLLHSWQLGAKPITILGAGGR